MLELHINYGKRFSFPINDSANYNAEWRNVLFLDFTCYLNCGDDK